MYFMSNSVLDTKKNVTIPGMFAILKLDDEIFEIIQKLKLEYGKSISNNRLLTFSISGKSTEENGSLALFFKDKIFNNIDNKSMQFDFEINIFVTMDSFYVLFSTGFINDRYQASMNLHNELPISEDGSRVFFVTKSDIQDNRVVNIKNMTLKENAWLSNIIESNPVNETSDAIRLSLNKIYDDIFGFIKPKAPVGFNEDDIVF